MNSKTTTDFQAKARMAASQIMSSTMNPAEALAKSLTSERPKIDSAIKSYMSLCAARSMSSASAPHPLKNANNNQLSSSSSSFSDLVTSSLAKRVHTNTATSTFTNESSSTNATSTDATLSQANHRSNNDFNLRKKEKCYFTKGKTNPNQAALLCARALLKCINSFTVPEKTMKNNKQETKCTSSTSRNNHKETKMDNNDDEDKILEYEVVKILWNGLVKSGKKPSMILGLTSLVHAYPLIHESCFQDNDHDNAKFPTSVDVDEAKLFFHEFGTLLQSAYKRKNKCVSSDGLNNDDAGDDNDDDDSCLLWDVDGGKAELERRRKRRENKQKQNVSSSCTNSANNAIDESLTIEEVKEEEEDVKKD